MRWTGWVGAAAGLAALTGCVYGYRTVYPDARYSASSRPHASYYCYDCHGYRFLDPYYDWCAHYGFRYRWAAHPRVVAIYRERYVRIREQHPEYGRYRYRPGYKSSTRYREARDYEAWRSGRSGSSERPPGVERRSKRSAPPEKEGQRERSRQRKEKGGSKEKDGIQERPSSRGGL